MINEQDRIIVSEERHNTESAPNNNLHSPTGVKPSAEVLGRPDARIGRITIWDKKPMKLNQLKLLFH